jgi:hypothetical protein
MQAILLIADIILLIINLGLAFRSYGRGEYKSAMFSSFAAGWIALAILALIIQAILI